MDAEAIDARWDEVKIAAAEAYARLCPPDLTRARSRRGWPSCSRSWRRAPDEFRLSLVTGNLEPIARLKLGRAGVGHYFEARQGGFGSDDEDRGRLPAIARGARLRSAVAARAHGRDRRHAARHRLRAGRRGARGRGRHRAVRDRRSWRTRTPSSTTPAPCCRCSATGSDDHADAPPPRRTGSATALKRLRAFHSMPVSAPISSPAGAR